MTDLIPAAELARKGSKPFPNESAEYRDARTVLLAEEIELRRHIQRVAEMRRVAAGGGEASKDYVVDAEGKSIVCRSVRPPRYARHL